MARDGEEVLREATLEARFAIDRHRREEAAGIDKLLNPKAKDEETLALIQHLTPSQRFDKLLENQQVLAEPIVRNGKKATVGYCPDVWGAWE